jgi:uncharacterized protein
MTMPVEVVRRFYDALASGDIPTVLSALDAEIEWTEAERFPYYGGTWHGPQAVQQNLFVPLSRDWQDFSVHVHDYIVDGNRVVTLGAYSGTYRKTDRTFSADFAHVWEIRRNKLARFNMYTDTAKVLEAINS